MFVSIIYDPINSLMSPRTVFKKLFSPKLTNGANKLKRLSLSGLSSLV
jgi:hypothetical protein